MNRLRSSALLVFSLAIAGCASQPPSRAAPEPVAATVDGSVEPAVVAPPSASETPAASGEPLALEPVATASLPAAAASGTAPNEASTASGLPEEDAGSDFALIYGTDAVAGSDSGDRFAALDPWEPMNRRVHAFNVAIDRGLMRPLARGYVKVVPVPVRAGVSNVFDNLAAPLAFGNLLLQGRPRESMETLGRFLVNTIVGIGGLFDPATKALKMHRHGADFGRTLARWGWQESRYLELPFLGPRTLRDAVGAFGDVSMAPLAYVEHDRTRVSLELLWLVDVRSGLLSLDQLREAAPDEYVLTRDAWLARRRYLVGADRSERDEGDESLPAYLLEAEPAPPRH